MAGGKEGESSELGRCPVLGGWWEASKRRNVHQRSMSILPFCHALGLTNAFAADATWEALLQRFSLTQSGATKLAHRQTTGNRSLSQRRRWPFKWCLGCSAGFIYHRCTDCGPQAWNWLNLILIIIYKCCWTSKLVRKLNLQYSCRMTRF